MAQYKRFEGDWASEEDGLLHRYRAGDQPALRCENGCLEIRGERCAGCGMCAAAVPAVFQIQGRVSVVQAQPRTPAEEAGAFDAANGCPVNAIRVTR